MKKSFVLIIIITAFIGCNSDTESIKLNQGVNFEEINKIKKKSFNFDKKNNYSSSEKTKDSSLNKNDLHQGCTAPCCSEGK
tara:strand:+ start:1085 stop:1327 length:243 start_codon:yes stop_codon:yes gene_type:complete